MWNADLTSPKAPAAHAPAAGAASQRPGRSNKATVRVLSVLSRFIGRRSSWGVTELSHELRLSKNMVHRALSTLVSENVLTRDSTGELYQLGPGSLAFAVGEGNEFDIVALARPYLEQLHALTGESVLVPFQCQVDDAVEFKRRHRFFRLNERR